MQDGFHVQKLFKKKEKARQPKGNPSKSRSVNLERTNENGWQTNKP